MKKDKHPKYQKVVFIDSSTGQQFVSGGCGVPVNSKETIECEGASCPVYRVSTSSFSHPYYTGDRRHLDAEGRIQQFQRRYELAAQRGKRAAK